MTANNPHRWEYLRAVRKDGKTPSPCACTPFRLSVGVTATDSFTESGGDNHCFKEKKGETPFAFSGRTPKPRNGKRPDANRIGRSLIYERKAMVDILRRWQAFRCQVLWWRNR